MCTRIAAMTAFSLACLSGQAFSQTAWDDQTVPVPMVIDGQVIDPFPRPVSPPAPSLEVDLGGGTVIEPTFSPPGVQLTIPCDIDIGENGVSC